MRIDRVTRADVPALLPLLRAYCDFYDVAPSDDDLMRLSQALIADPEHEGLQLVARDDGRQPIGFATLYWSWDTLLAARIAVLHDLFVAPAARRRGVAGALIDACRAECRERGAARLTWQTAHDNAVAQALYERVGAQREEWVDYWLPAGTRGGGE